MREVYIRCFLPLKFMKKIWAQADFLFWVDFDFWDDCFGFFEAINRFIMILKEFWVKIGWKWFLGKEI